MCVFIEDGFMVQDIVTREMSEVICPYVKQLKTVKQIESEEDYIKACNDLARWAFEYRI